MAWARIKEKRHTLRETIVWRQVDHAISVNFGFDQPQTLLVQLQGQPFDKVSAALGQMNGVEKIYDRFWNKRDDDDMISWAQEEANGDYRRRVQNQIGEAGAELEKRFAAERVEKQNKRHRRNRTA
jgi:hypothetical protein